MLHNMMKLYRTDFKKIPILRKLLKVCLTFWALIEDGDSVVVCEKIDISYIYPII